MESARSQDLETERKSNAQEKPEIKRLLRIRSFIKDERPKFIRQESWRYKRVKPSWRKPKGIDSKMRVREKGWPKSVDIGYGAPKKVRGYHPSGFKEVIINNVKDLETIDPGTLVRIGHTVGSKKRLKIAEKTKELKVRVVNLREVGKIESKESEKTGS